MTIEENKKEAPLESLEPSYDEDALGATMMEMDVGKSNPTKLLKKDTEKEEESVESLLKKQNSLTGRLSNLFGKK